MRTQRFRIGYVTTRPRFNAAVRAGDFDAFMTTFGVPAGPYQGLSVAFE